MTVGPSMSGLTPTVGPPDLEAQSFGPPTRKFSLIRRIATRSSKLEDPELKSINSSIVSSDEETKIFESLVILMVGNRSLQQSQTLNSACKWFRRYMRNNIIRFWTLIRQAVNDVDDYSPRPHPDELETVVKFVLEIARLMVMDKNLALSEIVDRLVNDNFFKQSLVDSDEYRIIPNHLVFAVVGWLSLLFQAPLVQPPHRLQIMDMLSTSPSPTGYVNSRYVRERTIGFGYIESPIYKLLSQFGDIIPEVKPETLRRDSLIPISEKIDVNLVSYGTALDVTQLKLEWVDSLSSHLELDESHQTLKLFRFPSYCRMMYHRQNIHLRLLTDLAMSEADDHQKEPVVRADELFREMLVTYRVLFGQDEHSHRAFARALPGYDRDWDCSAHDPEQISDPLLPVLCGRSCDAPEARALYNDINAGVVRDCYDATADFPIWGTKLCILQRFVKEYNPRSLKALARDRRDPVAFYHFWSSQTLLIFACVTTLIGILQLVFQIWQVVIALQQPSSVSAPAR